MSGYVLLHVSFSPRTSLPRCIRIASHSRLCKPILNVYIHSVLPVRPDDGDKIADATRRVFRCCAQVRTSSSRVTTILTLADVQRYIQDVSKAMAAELRQLMQEVGQLRDERQKLQRYVPYTVILI